MTLDDLVADVALEVPDAPRASIKDLLLRAIYDLCVKGNAWVVDDEPVVAGADTPYAELEAPMDAFPVRLLAVEVGGKALRPGTDYEQTSPTRITLKPAIKASTLRGRLAVRPRLGKAMPGELLDRHAETLRHGALARLLMLPQPWREPELALYHQRLWEAGVNDAIRLAAYGHQVGGARARPRRFI